MKKGPPPEEKGETAPLWIISFADMISLLMAFFVMLLTMATAKTGTLCNDGMGIFEHSVGGFKRAITGFGVPTLFGQSNEALDLETEKAHFALSSEDKTPGERTIDGREEKIRRLFTELDRRTTTYRAQLNGSEPEFTVAPVNFQAKSALLDPAAKSYLSQFITALQQSGSADHITVYIVGLAPDEAEIRDQWTTSAKRAQAVSDYLKSSLPLTSKLHIFSWGAATGGDWTASGGPAPKQAQLLIATLRNEK